MSNSLEEAFDVDSTEGLPENPFSTYEIPEEPTLDDIVRLGMQAFTEQMNDAGFIDPKFRARTLEVAHHFLGTAKDALKIKEELRQKDRKQDFDEKKLKPDEEGEEGGIDIVELSRMMAEEARKQKELEEEQEQDDE